MVASGYKHLSLEERKSIEVLLNHSDIKLKQIALSINHSPKCVREEIKAHRVVRIHSNKTNKCGRQDSCKKHRLCTYCISGDVSLVNTRTATSYVMNSSHIPFARE